MYVKQTPRPLFVTLSARLFLAWSVTGLLFSLSGSVSAQPQVIRNITQAVSTSGTDRQHQQNPHARKARTEDGGE